MGRGLGSRGKGLLKHRGWLSRDAKSAAFESGIYFLLLELSDENSVNGAGRAIAFGDDEFQSIARP